jgi:hypothetical protein
MEFDIEKTQRTVWDLTDRIEFFNRMLPLLNINEGEAEEIRELLQDRDFDYLEIAAYLGKQEDPDAALVFDGKKDFYWDIFNIKKSKEIINEVTELAHPLTKLSYKRGLTQRDWRKRLEALGGF